MPDTLQEVLEEFDAKAEPFSELSVSDRLDAVAQDHEELPSELLAERIAFSLWPKYEGGEVPWGTYYGPMMVHKSREGEIFESPSLGSITEEVIEYWERRAEESNHPLLVCRYSDLIWDFKYQVTQDRPAVDHAWNVVDKTVELVAGQQYKDGFEAERLLTRALSVAQALNDQDRVQQVVDIVLGLADQFDDPGEKRRAISFAFDLLMDNRRVELREADEQRLIDEFEEMLTTSTGGADRTGDTDHFMAEQLATRLAVHYRKANRPEDVTRVIKLYGETAIIAADAEESSMAASTWLQRVHENYISFALNEEAEEVLVVLREVSAGINDELRPVSARTEIPADVMDRAISDLTDGDLPEVLLRLATNSVSDIQQARDFVEEIARETILINLIPQQIVDREGRVVSSVGPLDEDPDGQHILQLSRNMQFESQILRLALERMNERLDPGVGQVLEALVESPLFPEERHELLRLGISAYLDDDRITSVHLLLPQIEAALRLLLVVCSRSTMRPHRNGGMILKNLDEILRDQAIVELLTERVTIYLRTLLCDQRGWNVRNNVLHGISEADKFNFMVADRVFLAVILLGQIRLVEEE